MNKASDVWSLVKPYFCSFQRANMRKQKEKPGIPRVLERKTAYMMILCKTNLY